jgi:hypothetical protein
MAMGGARLTSNPSCPPEALSVKMVIREIIA